MTFERLDDYASYFDYYVEHETLPEDFQRDVLTDYMLDVLDEPSNKILCKTDAIWRESIKTALLDFFEQMIASFRRIETQQDNEQQLIEKFLSADIDEKRQMWSGVVQFIKSAYPSSQINIASYSYQFGVEGADKELLFEMMCHDWLNACQRRFEQAKKEHIDRYRNRFETSLRERGSEDYETITSTQKIFVKYPALKELMDLMGREKENQEEERDSTITRYKPQLLSHHPVYNEVEGIDEGNTLSAVLPSETALLSEKDTEMLFYHKYATKRLQQFSSRQKTESQEKSTERHTSPRLNKGPVILSLDTSGSMQGHRLNIAISLITQILFMAKRQKRRCFLITFSVRARSIELSSTRNWRKLDQFLSSSYSGGTCGEQMLYQIIKALNNSQFSMADALIISDFEFPLPCVTTCAGIKAEQAKGTRFYGLSVSDHFGGYNKVLDRMWALNQ